MVPFICLESGGRRERVVQMYKHVFLCYCCTAAHQYILTDKQQNQLSYVDLATLCGCQQPNHCKLPSSCRAYVAFILFPTVLFHVILVVVFPLLSFCLIYREMAIS